MESDLLLTGIEYLKGVGPRRADILKRELNIFTFQDMLDYFPFRYVDKSQIHKISQIDNDGIYYQLCGTVSNMLVFGQPRMTRITAILTDETGQIELVWFKGLKWIKTRFKPGVKYVLFGKANVFQNRFVFTHPDIEEYNPDDVVVGESLQGVYNTTDKMKSAGLNTKTIARLQKTLLQQVGNVIPEILPKALLEKESLIPRKYAYYQIHLPANGIEIKQAETALKYEEHFFFQLQVLRTRLNRQANLRSVVFNRVGGLFNAFYNEHLPFELTNAQKRVIKEIREDLRSGYQMNRLLQGDVGSGKTIVALMIMLLAIDNGYQSALMAPTEILAQQHFQTITAQLAGMPINVALLTGSTKQSERRSILEGLANGGINIIIGTHALIEDKVVFGNLGLCVVDEQHRFGVAQRARFWEKTSFPPHMLVMTATPIPRTLAMTQFGDLDVSKIDELPPSRKPVKTYHLYPKSRLRLISFMKKQIAEGRQIYIVYPLIHESEKMDLINLQEGYEGLLRDFPEPEYKICVCHGQLKPEDKDFEMQRFVKHQAQIMIATTVIEVGVNVPNATVMIIENANRFGLSQLHQLRGRVGRGADQSYCILMTDYNLTGEGKKRMETMVATNDGFEIAEADLQLRGPGETQGTRQSGQIEMKIGNITTDEELIKRTRRMAELLLEQDPMLEHQENQAIRRFYEKKFKKSFDWGRIG